MIEHTPRHVREILSIADGREALLSVAGAHRAGELEVLVSTRNYDAQVHPVWCPVVYVTAGDGSPYPVKARVPNGALGQWRMTEVLAIAKAATPGVRDA